MIVRLECVCVCACELNVNVHRCVSMWLARVHGARNAASSIVCDGMSWQTGRWLSGQNRAYIAHMLPIIFRRHTTPLNIDVYD